MTKKIFLILTISFVLLLAIVLNPIFAVDKINWYTSYQDATRDATITRTPLMIYLYDTWSGDCEKIEKETFTDDTVISAAQNFICLKLDEKRYGDITDKYGILWYPSVLFLNPNGYFLNLISGFVDSDTLIQGMEKAIKKLK